MKNLITTPIYYPNAKPHLGHLYTNLIVDVYQKMNHFLGKQCITSSGVDQHGQKVYDASVALKFNPYEYAHHMSCVFADFFRLFEIEPVKWSQTVAKEHHVAVQHFWEVLYNKGFIYKGTYEGWYSIKDENYIFEAKQEDFLNSTDPSIVWRSEECYYFKLTAVNKKLINYFINNPDYIYPKTRYNEALSMLKSGQLGDFVISRPKERLSWGVAVPNDADHVIYVWFDALISYLSILEYPSKEYKKHWPAIHLLGKDILKFHAIYWSGMLIAADIPLPDKMLVHGWWLVDNEKISKSSGNSFDLIDLKDRFKLDALRYYLIRNMKLGDDGNFSEKSLYKLMVDELANKFGNLFLRLLGMIELFCKENHDLLDNSFNDDSMHACLKNFTDVIEEFTEDIRKIDLYLEQFITTLDFFNGYIEKNRIWEIEDRKLMINQLYFLLDIYRKITLLISPVLCDTARQIMEFLDLPCEYASYNLPMQFEISKKKPVLFAKKMPHLEESQPSK